jgi:hypothetical protein
LFALSKTILQLLRQMQSNYFDADERSLSESIIEENRRADQFNGIEGKKVTLSKNGFAPNLVLSVRGLSHLFLTT